MQNSYASACPKREKYGEWEDPAPGENETFVYLRTAALNHRDVFITQGLYLGPAMGTDEEFAAMPKFVEKQRIEPMVDKVFPLSEGQQAFDRMGKGLQFGKIVLKI